MTTLTAASASALQAFVAAATAVLFLTAALGKASAFADLCAWMTRHVPGVIVVPASVSLVAFDVGMAAMMLAADSQWWPNAAVAGALFVLLAVRLKSRGGLRDCPCFGSDAPLAAVPLNLLLLALLAANVIVLTILPRSPAPPAFTAAIGGAVVGAVSLAWLLLRRSASAPSSMLTGTLSREQILHFLSTATAGATALPERTIIVTGHAQCSSCNSIASALITVARLLPAQWWRLLDFHSRVRPGAAVIDGVPLTSLTPDVRSALQVSAVPAMTIIEASGEYATYRGADACRRAITELMATLPKQQNT